MGGDLTSGDPERVKRAAAMVAADYKAATGGDLTPGKLAAISRDGGLKGRDGTEDLTAPAVPLPEMPVPEGMDEPKRDRSKEKQVAVAPIALALGLAALEALVWALGWGLAILGAGKFAYDSSRIAVGPLPSNPPLVPPETDKPLREPRSRNPKSLSCPKAPRPWKASTGPMEPRSRNPKSPTSKVFPMVASYPTIGIYILQSRYRLMSGQTMMRAIRHMKIRKGCLTGSKMRR